MGLDPFLDEGPRRAVGARGTKSHDAIYDAGRGWWREFPRAIASESFDQRKGAAEGHGDAHG